MTRLNWLKVVLFSAMLAVTSVGFAQDNPQSVSGQASIVDINSADAATLAAALDGIGLVKAQEIVAYREMFGSFQSVDELVEVQGIGIATVEKNRHRIAIVKK